eukprot:365881-Chlamydomonas_euryale.AAC.2
MVLFATTENQWQEVQKLYQAGTPLATQYNSFRPPSPAHAPFHPLAHSPSLLPLCRCLRPTHPCTLCDLVNARRYGAQRSAARCDHLLPSLSPATGYGVRTAGRRHQVDKPVGVDRIGSRTAPRLRGVMTRGVDTRSRGCCWSGQHSFTQWDT